MGNSNQGLKFLLMVIYPTCGWGSSLTKPLVYGIPFNPRMICMHGWCATQTPASSERSSFFGRRFFCHIQDVLRMNSFRQRLYHLQPMLLRPIYRFNQSDNTKYSLKERPHSLYKKSWIKFTIEELIFPSWPEILGLEQALRALIFHRDFDALDF